MSIHFQPYSGWEEGEVQRGSLLVPLNTFDSWFLIIFPHILKISGPCVVLVLNYLI